MREAFQDDPVVADVHAAPTRLLAQHSGDIGRLLEAARERLNASDSVVIAAPDLAL